MKSRNVFFILQLTLFFLISITIMSYASARLTYEIKPSPTITPPPFSPKPPDQPNPGNESEEGNVLMLRSFSKLFMSFEALEQGRVVKAKELLQEAHDAQQKATAIYKRFASENINKPISTAKMTHDELKRVQKNFELYGLTMPKDYRELACLAYKEVKHFTEFITKVSFEDNPAQNRQTVREIIDRLNRYMRLGISISEIAASSE